MKTLKELVHHMATNHYQLGQNYNKGIGAFIRLYGTMRSIYDTHRGINYTILSGALKNDTN